MKPWTSDLQKKIAIRIKNKLDISELIKDVDIKGQNFSRAIIKDFHLLNVDIAGTNFYQAQLGEEGKISSFINCHMPDCCFEKARFLGKFLMHSSNAKRCSFEEAWFPDVEYKFTDFRGATFCHCVMKLGTEEGAGCKFDFSFLKELTKMWKVKVDVREEK